MRNSAPVQHRGVALILVLTTIAILTSIGVDFSYSSRVSLKLAENLRDETRAEYMAKSAVNLSRLLLHFQRQVDQLGGQLGSALQQLASGTPQTRTNPAAGAVSATPATQPGGLGIRLWDLLPIDSNAFSSLVAGDVAGVEKGESADASAQPRRGEGPAVRHHFGGFDGSFHGKVVDENSRINVLGLDGLQGAPLSALIQLRAMMSDPKYDFIFDEEDANRDRASRDDVILAMKDWIDLDETGSAIDQTKTTNPFVNGFSDENSAYSRYEPRYVAKNAHPDSLEEMYMVRGVNDRFMAAFGDRLTVWPNINSKLNINTDDPQQMLTNILIAAANPNDPALRDPRLLQTILQEIQVRKMFSFFGLSAPEFVSILQSGGIKLRPEIDPRMRGNAASFFGSTSDTFRIEATGRVGRIEKKVTAVVSYDEALGKMLYWKED
ncbi:MAG TPA: type II secretion system minor pseudopilin GspK [Myxococcales bacterium]|jgi:general secretion pathway protein K|nr:type II secretion system minor pseudopilin GspK [Myxococcales bacterium]